VLGLLGAGQQQRSFALVAGQRRRLTKRRSRFVVSTGAGEQVGAHGGEQVRAGERTLGHGIEHGQAGTGAERSPVGDGAVDLHDRAGCGLGQDVVQVRDGAPVGVIGRGGSGVLRRDRRLQVVPTDRLPARGKPFGALQRR
jgi:hypothetical protein